MNKRQQKQLMAELFERLSAIQESKGDDYAGDDRLSNFKLSGAITGIGTKKQILSLIATKVARLGNLYQGKTPNNESIEDTEIDLVNYCCLLWMSNLETDNFSVFHQREGGQNISSNCLKNLKKK
jgi:hypothetical protein